MEHQIKTLLFDIINAIDEIDAFFEESPKQFNYYCNDIKTRRAVERNLEIIGEAVNRILKTESPVKLSNVRKIIDTRNRIIHGYDTISDEIIWGIIINHLPVLKEEVEKLINKY